MHQQTGKEKKHPKQHYILKRLQNVLKTTKSFPSEIWISWLELCWQIQTPIEHSKESLKKIIPETALKYKFLSLLHACWVQVPWFDTLFSRNTLK